MRVPFIAGNWKMNKTPKEAEQLAGDVRRLVASIRNVEIAIAPAMACLAHVVRRVDDSNVKVAAQNVYWEAQGAYTGEVSVAMLKDVGCSHIIIGHSERRAYFGETDATVAKKVRATLDQGLVPIMCVGETLEEREAGKTLEVVFRQLLGGLEAVQNEDAAQVVVAYEPVWAIGTGRTASPEQAQEVHQALRGKLVERFGAAIAQAIRIQYGGSVTPANARELLSQPDIDGALVGGASLKAEGFLEIIRAAQP